MALVFIIGVAIGVAIALLIPKDPVMGILRVDRSDPFEGPQLFLEIDPKSGDITQHDYVKFKVLNESYITRD